MKLLRLALERRILNLTGHAIGGIDYDQPIGDRGLFGPDAVCWKIHADFPSMLVGGICALLLQMLHPIALSGVWDHSNFRSDMLGRLRRTARFISATTFAPAAAAREEIDRVRRIHGYVKGFDRYGHAYSANDPDLLTWVHVAEVHSFMTAYQKFSPKKLSAADVDRYFRETCLIATALGANGVPATERDIVSYLEEMRLCLRFDSRTRAVFDALRDAPAPYLSARVMQAPYMNAGFALLPDFAKDLYGIRHGLKGSLASMFVAATGPVIRWSLVNGAAGRSRRRLAVAE